ncbi:hypothetical protein Ct61P_07523 [Colletotrichum tofieldiae]|nr:hypothetical protein Ct61P_07523 [Colletotrichum tofieldiae]
MVDSNSSSILSIVLAIPLSRPLPATILLSSSGIKITHMVRLSIALPNMALPSMALLSMAPMLLRRCRLPITIQTMPPRSTRTRNTLSRRPISQAMDLNSHSSSHTASLMLRPRHTAPPNHGRVTILTLQASTVRLVAEAVMEMIEAALEELITWARPCQ